MGDMACNDYGVPTSRWVFLVPSFHHFIGWTVLHTQFVFVKVCNAGGDSPILFFVTEAVVLPVTMCFLIPLEFGHFNYCDVLFSVAHWFACKEYRRFLIYVFEYSDLFFFITSILKKSCHPLKHRRVQRAYLCYSHHDN